MTEEEVGHEHEGGHEHEEHEAKLQQVARHDVQRGAELRHAAVEVEVAQHEQHGEEHVGAVDDPVGLERQRQPGEVQHAAAGLGDGVAGDDDGGEGGVGDDPAPEAEEDDEEDQLGLGHGHEGGLPVGHLLVAEAAAALGGEGEAVADGEDGLDGPEDDDDDLEGHAGEVGPGGVEGGGEHLRAAAGAVRFWSWAMTGPAAIN